jgi:hypothetical protein
MVMVISRSIKRKWKKKGREEKQTGVSVGKGDTSIGVSSWQSDYSRQCHFTFQQHNTTNSFISLTYLINYFYPMVFGCYIMVGYVMRGSRGRGRGHGHDSWDSLCYGSNESQFTI